MPGAFQNNCTIQTASGNTGRLTFGFKCTLNLNWSFHFIGCTYTFINFWIIYYSPFIGTINHAWWDNGSCTHNKSPHHIGFESLIPVHYITSNIVFGIIYSPIISMFKDIQINIVGLFYSSIGTFTVYRTIPVCR